VIRRGSEIRGRNLVFLMISQKVTGLNEVGVLLQRRKGLMKKFVEERSFRRLKERSGRWMASHWRE